MDAFAPPDAYWAKRAVGTVAQDVEPLERDGKWTESLDRIIELYREDRKFFTADGAPPLADYERVLAALDTFWTNLVQEQTLNQRIGVDDATRFLIEDVGGTFRLLDNVVSIPPTANVDRARSLCLLGHNVRRYHERFNRPGREEAERMLQERVNRWNNFNEKGLTPFPWELALNEAISWFGSRAPLEPPRMQLIALRPGVAVDVDSKFGNRANVLSVEVLGLLWYFGGRGTYLAASALMASPSGSSVGWGAMFRIAPWMITGGPVWRDEDGDDDTELRWVLSVDAFDLLSGAPKSLLEAAKLATKGRARP